ncbi:MAG: glycosyltransferase family 39 protein [Bacteroidales bacterium]|nr:glycosyltransferase family 39 protein [Bacteroidales bacterium]
MVPFFPKIIANKGLVLYVVSLLTVSIAFNSFAMPFMWMLLGVAEVSLFFVLAPKLSKEWQSKSVKDFTRNLFWIAVLLRVVWVVFSYYFYLSQTGQPFEYGSADAIGYHDEADWLAYENWNYIWDFLFASRSSYSDSGYPFYLTVLYKIFGHNIMLARLLKTVYSAFTCVLLYKLASRTINEQVGRMVGVMAMLMPNLIIYCGLHLKETEMLLLVVAFLERTDFVLRSRKITIWNILCPLLLATAMFTFRTVLGALALFSFITALVFSPNRVMKKERKAVVAVWVVLAIVVLAGGTIMTEVESVWQGRGENQNAKRMEQTLRGNQWAKYATGTVMAPMIFVLPFSTMVDTGQENQMVLHGGNYVRNFMGVFVLITLYVVLFKKKNWRDFSLVGSFVIGYLGIISTTGFANSERFLLPGLPCLIIMWAYGVSELTPKSIKFVKYWYVIVLIMEIGWAYFKIGSRGLLG